MKTVVENYDVAVVGAATRAARLRWQLRDWAWKRYFLL